MSIEGDEEAAGAASEVLEIQLGPETAGDRLDKALAAALPQVSRARLQALIASGHVTREGARLASASAKATPGAYEVELPPPEPAEPEAQAIALTVLYEDDQLIVLDKPAVVAARSRMHGHARRLVQHDQLVVLVEHAQRDRLRFRLGRLGRGQLDLVGARRRLGRSRRQAPTRSSCPRPSRPSRKRRRSR